jgi:hypothetical protein
MCRVLPVLGFFLLVLALSSWHLDRGHNANTLSRAAMVAALVERHSLKIDAYHELTDDKALVDGHYYSEKAPLPALVVVPFWWLADRLHLIERGDHGLLTDDLLALGGFLCGSVPFALIITLTWLRVRERPTALPGAWMVLLPFFGSYLFVYSGSFHGHLLAALCLLIAWRARTQDRTFWSGAFAAGAVLSEYSLFVFPLIWVLQDLAQGRWRSLLRMALGGAPGLALLLVANYKVTGSPFTLPYTHVASHVDTTGFFGMSVPSLEALWGLLFSFYRGLFTHAPVAIMGVVVLLVLQPRTAWREWLFHPLLLPSVVLLLMIASHSMWWGGWAFGPRHLTAIAVLLLAGGLPLLPDRGWVRWSLLLLGSWGLLLAFAAKSTTGYSLPTEVMHPFRDLMWPAISDKRFSHMQWAVDVGFSATMGTTLFVLAFLAALRWTRRAAETSNPAQT